MDTKLSIKEATRIRVYNQMKKELKLPPFEELWKKPTKKEVKNV